MQSPSRMRHLPRCHGSQASSETRLLSVPRARRTGGMLLADTKPRADPRFAYRRCGALECNFHHTLSDSSDPCILKRRWGTKYELMNSSTVLPLCALRCNALLRWCQSRRWSDLRDRLCLRENHSGSCKTPSDTPLAGSSRTSYKTQRMNVGSDTIPLHDKLWALLGDPFCT